MITVCMERAFYQLDVSINFHADPVSLGVWYRGKPFTKNISNAIDQDALILFLGLHLKEKYNGRL